jgi:hypothetical protein
MTKRDPTLRAQIKALEAAVKADKAERRAAEAPIRRARAELMKRIHNMARLVHKHNQRLADLLALEAATGLVNPYKLEQTERYLKDASASFRSRLVDLQTFDALHNIVGADYPTLPELDREATIKQARAEHQRRMTEYRLNPPSLGRRAWMFQVP